MRRLYASEHTLTFYVLAEDRNDAVKQLKPVVQGFQDECYSLCNVVEAEARLSDLLVKNTHVCYIKPDDLLFPLREEKE